MVRDELVEDLPQEDIIISAEMVDETMEKFKLN